MVDILLLLIFNTFLCVGVYVATQWDGSDQFDNLSDILQKRGKTIHNSTACDGNPFADVEYRKVNINDPMLLWWIRYYGSYLPKFWQKPLYRCLPCMASVWSVPVIITAMLIGVVGFWEGLIIWPTYVLSLAGINYYVSSRLL